MTRGYLVFGLAVSLFFAYATWTGWSLWDTVSDGQWSPEGQRDVSHK